MHVQLVNTKVMKAVRILSVICFVIVFVAGCIKEKDPTTINNDIELTENPDPVKRVSGTYNSVKVEAAFKQGDGFRSYSEGNYALAEPDGKIQGGKYQLIIAAAGANTVQVSIQGQSTNFAAISKAVGTFTVSTNINGSITEYQLRKSMNEPIAILIKRYDYRSQVQGFEYDVTFNYYVNKSSGAVHLGNQEEIEPLPTNWFYLSGDLYTQYFKMIRKTSLS